MDGLTFQKIKNSLFNEYSLLDQPRFFDLIAKSNAYFWKEIGEASPFSGYGKLPERVVATGTLERLATEPYPIKFLELCVALGKHIKYVSALPAIRHKVEGMDMQKAFMDEVEAAFRQHKQTLYFNSTLHSDSRIVGPDDYTMQKESEKFILNGFRPRAIEEYVEQQTRPYRTKAHKIEQEKQGKTEHKWFWWAMGIVDTIIAGLVLAHVFGIGLGK